MVSRTHRDRFARHGAVIALARVAISEAIHAPEREEAVTAWIRAAQADKELKAGGPAFAATILQGQVKAFGFWPQVTMGAAPITPSAAEPVIEAAVSMFLAYFGVEQ